MTKAIALIALSLSLEAAFLFQISVIARPERAAPAPASQVAATARTEPPVAQSSAPAQPRS